MEGFSSIWCFMTFSLFLTSALIEAEESQARKLLRQFVDQYRLERDQRVADTPSDLELVTTIEELTSPETLGDPYVAELLSELHSTIHSSEYFQDKNFIVIYEAQYGWENAVNNIIRKARREYKKGTCSRAPYSTAAGQPATETHASNPASYPASGISRREYNDLYWWAYIYARA